MTIDLFIENIIFNGEKDTMFLEVSKNVAYVDKSVCNHLV